MEPAASASIGRCAFCSRWAVWALAAVATQCHTLTRDSWVPPRPASSASASGPPPYSATHGRRSSPRPAGCRRRRGRRVGGIPADKPRQALSLSAPVRVVLCVGGHRARTGAEMGDAHTRADAMRCGRGFARAGTSLSNSGHLATRLFDMYSTCIEAAPRRLRLHARSRKELRGAAEAKPANS